MWNDREPDSVDFAEIEAHLYSQLHHSTMGDDLEPGDITQGSAKKTVWPRYYNGQQSYSDVPPNKASDKPKQGAPPNSNNSRQDASSNGNDPKVVEQFNKKQKQKRNRAKRAREKIKKMKALKKQQNLVQIPRTSPFKENRINPNVKLNLPRNNITILLSDSEDEKDPRDCLLVEEKVDTISLTSDNEHCTSKESNADGSDDVIFVRTEEPPPPEEISLLSDSESLTQRDDDRGKMKPPSDTASINSINSNSTPSKQRRRPQNLIVTPESSNDFIDSSVINQSKENFNFGVHGSAFVECGDGDSFIRPRALNEMCGSESSCSDITPVRRIVPVATPVRDIFSDRNLESFEQFITTDRSASRNIPSLLSSSEQSSDQANTSSQSNEKQLPELSYFAQDTILDVSKSDSLVGKGKRKSTDNNQQQETITKKMKLNAKRKARRKRKRDETDALQRLSPAKLQNIDFKDEPPDTFSIPDNLYVFSDVELLSGDDDEPSTSSRPKSAPPVDDYFSPDSNCSTISARLTSQVNEMSKDLVLPNVGTSNAQKRPTIDWNNCELEDIHRIQSDNPNMWKILDRDRYYMKSSIRDPRCLRCKEFGHIMYKCKAPPIPIKCRLCGVRGHLDHKCPNKICTQCGRASDASKQIYCKKCFRIKNAKCTLCHMQGHLKEYCPDLWRRYYLTTKEGPVVKPPAKPASKAHKQWCCVCGRNGHLSFKCGMPARRGHPPSVPYVVDYTDIYGFPKCDMNKSMKVTISTSNMNEERHVEIASETPNVTEKEDSSSSKTQKETKKSSETQKETKKSSETPKETKKSSETQKETKKSSDIADQSVEDKSKGKSEETNNIQTTNVNTDSIKSENVPSLVPAPQVAPKIAPQNVHEKEIQRLISAHKVDTCKFCQFLIAGTKEGAVDQSESSNTASDIIHINSAELQVLNDSFGKALIKVIETKFNVTINCIKIEEHDYCHITGSRANVDDAKEAVPKLLEHLKSNNVTMKMILNAMRLIAGISKLCPLFVYKQLAKNANNEKVLKQLYVKLNIMLFAVYDINNGQASINKIRNYLFEGDLNKSSTGVKSLIYTVLYQKRSTKEYCELFSAYLAGLSTSLSVKIAPDEQQERNFLLPVFADLLDIQQGYELIGSMTQNIRRLSYEYCENSYRFSASVTLQGEMADIEATQHKLLDFVNNLEVARLDAKSLTKLIAMYVAKITVLYYTTSCSELLKTIKWLEGETAVSNELKRAYWKLNALLFGHFQILNGKEALETLKNHETHDIKEVAEAFNTIFDCNRKRINYEHFVKHVPVCEFDSKSYDMQMVKNLSMYLRGQCMQRQLNDEFEQLAAFDNYAIDQKYNTKCLFEMTHFLNALKARLGCSL